MDYVAHHMKCGILPGYEGAVVPDFGCFLNGHEWVKLLRAAQGAHLPKRNANYGGLSLCGEGIANMLNNSEVID